MTAKRLLLAFLLILTFVVISLFIELSYVKHHADLIFMCPEKILVIKGEELDEDDDIVIYNSLELKRSDAIKKIPKRKQSKYHEKTLTEHLSRKISKPFEEAYRGSKENTSENLPISYAYKTALSVVELTHGLTSAKASETQYHMLISKNSKHQNAFIDGMNIYIL